MPVSRLTRTLRATRERLLPTSQDEAPAARASREARLYLERRRRQLNAELHTGP